MAYSNRRWGDTRSGGKGESMNRVSGKRAAALRVGIGLLVLLMAGLPAMTKVDSTSIPTWIFPNSKHMPISVVWSI